MFFQMPSESHPSAFHGINCELLPSIGPTFARRAVRRLPIMMRSTGSCLALRGEGSVHYATGKQVHDDEDDQAVDDW